MIRPYCGECGQEMATCECQEDERFTLLNMTQEDFDAALAEAYQRGQEDMRKRAAALVRAIRNECPLADYLYRNGWLGSATYAEMRIRDLEV